MCFLSIFNSPVLCTKNDNPSCPHSHAHTIDLHKSKKNIRLYIGNNLFNDNPIWDISSVLLQDFILNVSQCNLY